MTLPAPDLSAERALLGAVLINPDALAELPWIGPQTFYAHHHRWIWEAAVTLAADGITPDLTAITHQLDLAGKLVEAGGAAYLVRCMTDCESSQNHASYGRLVERDYKRRQLLEGAEKIASMAHSGKGDPRPILGNLERLMAGRGSSTAVDAGDVAPSVWEAVAYPERMTARLVPTGLADWDRTLGGGLERGTLSVIMARPSMGKTALLVQVADYVTEHGGTVAVFSLEMTSRQFLLRMACRRARVSVLALRQGSASESERDRVLIEVAALSERHNLILDDTPQTTDQARATCDKIGNLTLVLADHLRLFSDTGENENKRQGNTSWALKRLAKGLDVPVLLACQLNRGLEQGKNDRHRDLKDLRDSGEIEENADNVTALFRASYYNDNPLDRTAELINRKARDGERNARCKFAFLGPYMSFEPLARGSDDE